MSTTPEDTPAARRLNAWLGPLPEADAWQTQTGPWGDQSTDYAYSAKAMEAERQRCYAAGLAAERERWPDRYALGDAIRRAWKKHGQDSWCSIADDVLRAFGRRDARHTAPEAALKADALAEALRDMLMHIGNGREDGVEWVCEPIHSDEIKAARAALEAFGDASRSS